MSDPIEKSKRQREILSVLRDENIASQEELRKSLKRRGYPVTQATLSRDLWDLKVMRVPGEDGYRYLPAGDTGSQSSAAAAAEPLPRQLRSVAAMEVTGIESNEMCVVVRTLTGRAQGVAVYIDSLKLEDALATVAGDDTIVALPKSIKRTARLEAELKQRLGLT